MPEWLRWRTILINLKMEVAHNLHASRMAEKRRGKTTFFRRNHE
jgi:hypothetical protein